MEKLKMSQRGLEKAYLKTTRLKSSLAYPKKDYRNLLEDGKKVWLNFYFITAIYEYINEAETIFSFQSSSYSNLELINEGTKAVFFILENSGEGFLSICLELIETLSGIYKERYQIYKLYFTCSFIVSLVFLILMLLVLIPIVFRVYKSMNHVMGLFAYVSEEQIESLAEKCREFRADFMYEISEMDVNRAKSEILFTDSELEGRSSGARSQIKNSEISNSYNGDDSLNRSYGEKKIEKEFEGLRKDGLYSNPKQVNHNISKERDGNELLLGALLNNPIESEHSNRQSEDGMLKMIEEDLEIEAEHKPAVTTQKQEKKIKEEVIEEEAEFEGEDENSKLFLRDKKSPKGKKKQISKKVQGKISNSNTNLDQEEGETRLEILQKSRENFSKALIIKFSLTSLIIGGLLAIAFTLTSGFTSDVDKIIDHLRILSLLHGNIKYLSFFTIESLNYGDDYKIDGKLFLIFRS